MAANNGDEQLDTLLGVGFGIVAIISGFLATAFVIQGLPGNEGLQVVLITTGLLGIAYLVAGVYDTAYAKAYRGVSNLVAAAGMVLCFLATFASYEARFMAAGAVFLFVAGLALIACGLQVDAFDRLPGA